MLQSTQLKSTTTKLPEKSTAQSMNWKIKIKIPRKFINTKLLSKLKKDKTRVLLCKRLFGQ